MRAGRAWFIANFKPKTLAGVAELCPPGSENGARMRMVTTYWDMVASFITAGVLNPELTFTNNREMLVVWFRMERIIGESRAAYRDPNQLKNLEIAGKQFIEYLEKTSPGSVEPFKARILGG